MIRSRLLAIAMTVCAVMTVALTGCGGTTILPGPTPTPPKPLGTSTESGRVAVAEPGEGTLSLEATGAVVGKLLQDKSVTCLRLGDQGPADLEITWTAVINKARYRFAATIYHEFDAGPYLISRTDNKFQFSSDNGAKIWDGFGGSITMAAGNRSGRMFVTSSTGGTPEAPQQLVTISGGFYCA